MKIPETLIPHLAQLQKFAKTRGVELYLVGGSVRDLLLNRPTADLDFALATDAIPFAKAFAAHVGGGFVGLDERPPTARVVFKKQTVSMDFAQFRAASLNDDLQLRDLTINAMAVPLEAMLESARLPVPRLIDPGGGMADLTARQLRFPSERVIHEDPLRLIRIYRFAAQLNFEICHDSLALIKKHHALLPRVSAERIRDELMKILKVEKASPYLQEMWKVGLLTQIVPTPVARGHRDREVSPTGRNRDQEVSPTGMHRDQEVSPTGAREPVQESAATPVARGPVPRDPWNALDRFESTNPAQPDWDTYLNTAATPVARGPVPRDPWNYTQPDCDTYLKPAATPVARGPVPRDPWNYTQPDCDTYLETELEWEVNRSSLIKLCLLLQGELGDVAKRLKLSRKASQFLKCLASEHRLLAAEQLTRREIIRFLRRTGSDWLGALLFASALHGITDARTSQIVDTYYQHFLPILKQGRLITGEDLIHRFDLKEGREIGFLLAEIEERQLDGEIRTREEAFAAVAALITFRS